MKKMNELAGFAATVANSLTALWLSTNQIAIIGATVLSSEMVLWLPLPVYRKNTSRYPAKIAKDSLI